MSVYKSLWDNNMDIARQTLKTPFMQHMKKGDLQSYEYVTFMIQDINYLVKVTAMLKTMSERVRSPEDLRYFFQDRYKSYNTLTESMLKQFNLKEVKIEPIPAMEIYQKDYETIMEKEENIFCAVSFLAHSRLRFWIANQLVLDSSNAYYDWMKNNMDGDPEDHYRKLLDSSLNSSKDIDMANTIFRQQMQNELNFFAASSKV